MKFDYKNQITPAEDFLMQIRGHLQGTIDLQWDEPKEDIKAELEGIIDNITEFLDKM